MYEKYYHAFQSSLLCQNLSMEQVEAFLAMAKPTIRSYQKGSIIRYEESAFADVGMVLSGEVMQVRINAYGDRSIFETMQEGQLFGEILMFLTQKKNWPADIVAKSDCEILFLDIKKLESLKDHVDIDLPQLLLNLIQDICMRAENLMAALRCFRTKSIRGRIANYLYENCILMGENDFTLPHNQEQMADYLFISRPRLSREFSLMKAEGLIDYHRSKITIFDVEALKQYL